jgi:serine/threonine-protein phosphatase with EF-hand domain
VTKTLSLRERVNAIESSAIKHLLEKFLANKNRLLNEYKTRDAENTGVINLNDWCEITGSVLELNLPWRTLYKKLVKLNEVGDIYYQTPFTDSKFDTNLEKLVRLGEIFLKFDPSYVYHNIIF